MRGDDGYPWGRRKQPGYGLLTTATLAGRRRSVPGTGT